VFETPASRVHGKSPREGNIGNSRELLNKLVQALRLLVFKLFFPLHEKFKFLNSFMLCKRKASFKCF